MDFREIIQMIAKHDNVSYSEAEKQFNQEWMRLAHNSTPKYNIDMLYKLKELIDKYIEFDNQLTAAEYHNHIQPNQKLLIEINRIKEDMCGLEYVIDEHISNLKNV